MSRQRLASLLLAFFFIGGALALMALGSPTGKEKPRSASRTSMSDPAATTATSGWSS